MKWIFKKPLTMAVGALAVSLSFSSCSKEETENLVKPTLSESAGLPSKDGFVQYSDTYWNIASWENSKQWGPYNAHDPSIIKEGAWYYSYSTDASFGNTAHMGIQIRKSKDLINWKFHGLALDSLPPSGAAFIREHGGEPFQSLWAPYIMKVGNEFRLYYSLTGPTPRLSVIGLLTSTEPTGPWEDKGLVVTSLNDRSVQTNAIDPSVVVSKTGEHWFYYGSAWDGIYVLKLDPATGLAATPGDKGKRIAQRGFTGGRINGNIEGPEVVYNPEFDKYYMFISYDWLATKYNVRVGRSDSPEGPFYDFHGRELNGYEDNGPMILAPYKFEGHSGWQGVSHPAVFQTNGQFYMAHQGRPGENMHFMVLHTREISWTKDGWPLVSPERYVGIEQTPVAREELVGEWEEIVLGYRIVPGYAEEQTSPDFAHSFRIELFENGTIFNDPNLTWTYEAPWLTLKWGDAFLDKLKVERARDWENRIDNTLTFTGLNMDGLAIWGKKVKQ